jgi:hypothetical protein
MITLTYTITMGILCLISWGLCGYIWYEYRKWERKQANTRLELSNYKVFC